MRFLQSGEKDMKVKDYLMDRFSLILSYIVSLCLFGLVLQLQSLLEKRSIDWNTWLYGLLLGQLFYCISHLRLPKTECVLKRIKKYVTGGNTLHDSLLIDTSYTAEQEMVVESFTLLRQQYMNEVHKQHAKEQQQMIFMNQWIHQMKTPVSVIELLLQKFGKEHREARATVESIREENNRILNGLDLALHMARLEQFAKDYKVEVVNVIDIIRGIINENRKSFIQSSVFPKVMFEEDTCMVASDRKWLSIAIGQIVVNAIKYTKISEAEKKEIQFQIEEKDQGVITYSGQWNRYSRARCKAYIRSILYRVNGGKREKRLEWVYILRRKFVIIYITVCMCNRLKGRDNIHVPICKR